MTATPLPEELRLPRAQWSEHPHYPRQVLLVRSHEQFRLTSRSLVDRAARGDDLETIGWRFSLWKAGMANHERYEEGKLYPYLEARWPLSCEPLQSGHHELAERERGVRNALERRDHEAVHASLAAHDETLLDHLEVEEALVVPALLALSPEEFDRYVHTDVRTLLSQLDRSAR